MTYTEQYNQYVQEWIKENPAFSGPYEPMLEFDEWVDKYMVEFAEWLLSRSLGETIQLKDDTLAKYKKEKGL